MTPPRRPIWPSDDQVHERERDREFTDDGRRIAESEHVGGIAPDADPEPQPPRPRRTAPR